MVFGKQKSFIQQPEPSADIMSRIDLHTHSTASDGSFSPTELVNLAKEKGLVAMALTDHDTTSGLEEAGRAGQEFGVDIIPGVELSVLIKGGTFHLLGLGIHETPELCAAFKKFIHGRDNRNRYILEKLAALGMPITEAELEAAVPGAVPGRPHIARLMVDKGFVSGTQEAFDLYLKKGAPAYQGRFRLPDKEAIELILGAGGIPVMAHPFSLKMEAEDLEAYLQTLKGYGLRGIEAYYSKHTPEQQALYLSLAEKLGLLVTGGSDFHGASKPDISLGKGLGEMEIPFEVYVELKSVLGMHQAAH